MDHQWVIDRATRILKDPKNEWPVIAAEEASVAGLYQRYILILAALPAIAGLIKSSILGYGVPFVGTVRAGFGAGISGMIMQYLLTLVSVFVIALVIEALATSFDGEKNRIQALKTVTYASTAAWVGGVLIIVPWIGGLLGLLAGVYSLYLLYLGLHHTMHNPEEKSLGYAVVTVIAAIVLQLLVGAVVGSVTGMGVMMNPASNMGGSNGLQFDPDSPIGKAEALAKHFEEAGKEMEQADADGDADARTAAARKMLVAVLGGGKHVESLAPEKLTPLVPDSLAGLDRRSREAARNSAMGMQVSNADAEYGDGERSISLEITDAGGAMALTGLAAWTAFEQDKQSDQGYERTYRDGNRSYHEVWSKADGHAEYTAIVGDRFVINLESQGLSMDELKAAMDEINLDAIEAMKSEGVVAG